MSSPVASGSDPWRLIVHAARDGAWNMAVDEALLESYTAEAPPPSPTLRIYGWAPPALSLGRQQAASGAHDPSYLRAHGIHLVRRPTGGRAVLHADEVTYAVVGRLRRGPFPGGVIDTYGRIAEALLLALREMGLPAQASAPSMRERQEPNGPVCFEAPSVHEIVIGHRKLVGSAQLRRGGAFLQHGSLPYRLDPERLAGATGAAVNGSSFTDIEGALGGAPEAERVRSALTAGFEQAFGIRLRVGDLTPEEAARAVELRSWKYDSSSFTHCGRIGDRERRWGPPLPM